MTEISLRVNGRDVAFDESLRDVPLLWALRDHLQLTGTKFGCGHGGCGVCTVHVDGVATPSCTTTCGEVAGKSVLTIEGLAAEPEQPIFRAFVAEQTAQCGYCQPGMIMAASALLAQRRDPSDAEIDQAMSHVLCRCGTYPRVKRAIHLAARENWADAAFPQARFEASARAGDEPPGDAPLALDPWIKIAANGDVVAVVGRAEMGQGVSTAICMLIAEELTCPLARMRFEFAPVGAAYENPILHRQITVGSLSMQTTFEPVRMAAAAVRERLRIVAARRWNVDPAACRVENGAVLHPPSRRHAHFGELRVDAAAEPTPRHVHIAQMDQFRVLGVATPRLDLSDHISGRTPFAADIALPGLRVAVPVLAPCLGAELVELDATAALATPGVLQVARLSGGAGAAVVATDSWSALQGRDALKTVWRNDRSNLSSETISRTFAEALTKDGEILQKRGDAAGAARGARIVEAVYETPFLAHATMEPMICVAQATRERCDVWAPTQSPTLAQEAAARAAGLPLAAVYIHSTFLGGGFGRRSTPDVVAQAVEIAKAVGAPVRLFWTRDDDIRHDLYRPASAVRLRGALAVDGKPLALVLRIVGPTLAADGLDFPYDIPNLSSDFVEDDLGVPTSYWRSVGASQNAFALESFIDELACAAHCDPVAYRLSLLGRSPRHRAVLERAAEIADWGGRVEPGCGRGAALYYAHGGFVAQIVDVSTTTSGFRVERVVCAVDCGFAINPDTVRAQIEGGVIFGLTAALEGRITLAAGAVVERGFKDYPLLTMAECPTITVSLLQSREPPTGAGECGVPPVAPAVANALFAATGERRRILPLQR